MFIVYSFNDYYLTTMPETWSCRGLTDCIWLIPGSIDPSKD
jgi:hypothetical protein